MNKVTSVFASIAREIGDLYLVIICNQPTSRDRDKAPSRLYELMLN